MDSQVDQASLIAAVTYESLMSHTGHLAMSHATLEMMCQFASGQV